MVTVEMTLLTSSLLLPLKSYKLEDTPSLIVLLLHALRKLIKGSRMYQTLPKTFRIYSTVYSNVGNSLSRYILFMTANLYQANK